MYQFQEILVLSAAPSWRTRGLLAAAQLTGLQLKIPKQPPIHPDLVNAFQALGPEEIRHPTHGASAAWLAHLDLLKHVWQSDLDTALIIEDDVDWDVTIREQTVRIAEAVRNLTHTQNNNETAPYGRAWDVIWIGHCGEFWDDGVEAITYEDTNVCPHDKYMGWAKGAVSRLPDHQRNVYWSWNPVCSFAYGVSSEGARKILTLLGGAQDEAFDVSMMHLCQEKVLSCISVVPEVVHQYFPPESFGVKSLVDIGNGEVQGDVDDLFESTMGSTENILESARCHASWGRSCLKV